MSNKMIFWHFQKAAKDYKGNLKLMRRDKTPAAPLALCLASNSNSLADGICDTPSSGFISIGLTFVLHVNDFLPVAIPSVRVCFSSDETDEPFLHRLLQSDSTTGMSTKVYYCYSPLFSQKFQFLMRID